MGINFSDQYYAVISITPVMSKTGMLFYNHTRIRRSPAWDVQITGTREA
jgi:hypothetical protein